jgi:hypothetical protein
MASPEQVSRRVERAEQDITAISDTTLDIKETVDGHTETLAQHGRTLAEHGRTLAEHGRTLAEHGRTLAQQGRTLAEHGRKLDGITGRLDTLETGINQGFAEILRRLDNNPLRAIEDEGPPSASTRTGHRPHERLHLEIDLPSRPAPWCGLPQHSTAMRGLTLSSSASRQASTARPVQQ